MEKSMWSSTIFASRIYWNINSFCISSLFLLVIQGMLSLILQALPVLISCQRILWWVLRVINWEFTGIVSLKREVCLSCLFLPFLYRFNDLIHAPMLLTPCRVLDHVLPIFYLCPGAELYHPLREVYEWSNEFNQGCSVMYVNIGFRFI
jgi:hypothetical protein